jgi:alkylation response protein AidB-like acyl-CoA dehydrogenase
LTDEMLARFAGRAEKYDRENTFFTEDFEDLRRAGYLKLAVPKELGGYGLKLADVVREQRRLGYHAAATALAINMHLYWTGVAADLWRAGDTSQQWILEAAVRGEVFAAGHAESGNDIPVLLSTTRAERVEGGYRFTGRKSFGSLSPVWTYLGLHGMDTADPAAPKVVHAFMPRDTEGYRIEETWDVMGMRATRSDDTILDGVFVPDRYIARNVPAGAAGIDQFVLAIFAWALLGFGNIYYGLARRVLDSTIQTVKTKRSIALTRPMPSGRTSIGSPKTGQPASITEPSGRRNSSRRSITPSRAPGASWISRSRSQAASGSSGAAGSSDCSATRGSGVSIRPTRC